jgi:hypothetical protein
MAYDTLLSCVRVRARLCDARSHMLTVNHPSSSSIAVASETLLVVGMPAEPGSHLANTLPCFCSLVLKIEANEYLVDGCLV